MACKCIPCKKEEPAPPGMEVPGRTDPSASPGVVDPSAQPPSALRQERPHTPPCYYPQPKDVLVEPPKESPMGPVGPWATGKLDWSPLAGLTGTRPVVDKYSITRYSEGEWRRRNYEMLQDSAGLQQRMDQASYNGHQLMNKTQTDADRNQSTNTNKLRTRDQEMMRWKNDTEMEIQAMTEEIQLMSEQRRRLQQAAEVLLLPESIAGECLERRTGRMDPELVRDEVEEELIKELALTAECRETFYRTLKDVEHQLEEDKTAKQRLEYDWSDKSVAHDIDTHMIALNNTSRTLLFKPGSVIMPEDQSTPEYWTHFSQETYNEARKTRQKSADLRATLGAILENAARDLRTQSENVGMALSRRVGCTQEMTQLLENELKKILQKLADVETLKDELLAAIRHMDVPMKKVQTRLHQRLLRPRVESCRDAPQIGMIDEVRIINEQVTALQKQLDEADKCQSDLIKYRNDLERELIVKRKTIEIDVERTNLIRAFYPSAVALSGH